ncbi:MAG: tRNA (N6-threonylcarbamoyladenosine(37)-N6)-methyltransferase TrmO [Oligoflexia bacterium]|nr:tRNA (N6-threonylcarbamoyladenosine(37)-N6)-methyltransferase TrmO [Oligoflexia bacterium]
MKITPIAFIRTPFTDKFGIPKQPSLTPSAIGKIIIEKEFAKDFAFKELEEFTHLTVIFGFHKTDGWDLLVRPPRLGGNKKVGVYSTRSPFRPNNLGISHLEIQKLVLESNHVEIHVKAVDLLDGTPIYDIKPYIPRWDSFPDASMGWIEQDPELLNVSFSESAESFLSSNKEAQEYKQLIIEVLSQDPRPAYKKGEFNQPHHSQIADLKLSWTVTENGVQVTDITK